AKMLRMLIRLPRRNTDALIGGVADELAREGIELIDSTFFVKDHIPGTGVITRRAANSRERGDIEYGLEIAREMARLDLGQTVVVRERACVAIEAMEGTDAVIRRAGTLARGSLTVVKVAKPNQDMRFDVPVVGLSTIEAMIEARATCLSITADKTLLFDREEVIRLANKHRITIVAV
ncbi:MAG: LpxI family protein, partial [Pyrinomonadaceae bacterium]